MAINQSQTGESHFSRFLFRILFMTAGVTQNRCKTPAMSQSIGTYQHHSSMYWCPPDLLHPFTVQRLWEQKADNNVDTSETSRQAMNRKALCTKHTAVKDWSLVRQDLLWWGHERILSTHIISCSKDPFIMNILSGGHMLPLWTQLGRPFLWCPKANEDCCDSPHRSYMTGQGWVYPQVLYDRERKSSFLLGGSLSLTLLGFPLASQFPQPTHLLLEVLVFISGGETGRKWCYWCELN